MQSRVHPAFALWVRRWESGPARHRSGRQGGSLAACGGGNTRVATGSGSLSGIGRAAAAKIWYRALTTKFTTSTNYAAARKATITAAQELAATLGSDYSAKVAAAWTAVGVN